MLCGLLMSVYRPPSLRRLFVAVVRVGSPAPPLSPSALVSNGVRDNMFCCLFLAVVRVRHADGAPSLPLLLGSALRLGAGPGRAGKAAPVSRPKPAVWQAVRAAPPLSVGRSGSPYGRPLSSSLFRGGCPCRSGAPLPPAPARSVWAGISLRSCPPPPPRSPSSPGLTPAIVYCPCYLASMIIKIPVL